MTRHDGDTIAALATPVGQGGVGIVRVSGPRAAAVAQALLGRVPAPRHADYLPFHDAQQGVIDQGIALYFPAPHSFTGEDVLELHGHGGPVVMDMLLNAVLACGVRAARPGEFSERAFLNDKIDLAQAEAIADLIASTSTRAAQSALRSLQGEFSTRVHALLERLIELRLYVEAAIDFPEEEIDFLATGTVAAQLAQLITDLQALQHSAQQGSLLREGMHLVIAGPPNAGKSSLLNALARRQAAIVTDIPGTTRDVVREQITLDGLPLHIIDTAGLHDSDDPVEQLGMQRARDEIARADRVLLLFDDSDYHQQRVAAFVAQLPKQCRLTVVRNKIDLSGHAAALRDGPHGPEVLLSVREGSGMELLGEHLKACVGFDSSAGEGQFIARRRHLDSLQRTLDQLEHGRTQLCEHHAGELLAEDLRQAQQALGEITGEFSSDDLLGRIFASFCIGK